MMKFVFDEDKTKYSAGDFVVGSVRITTKSKIKCKSLKMKTEGCSMLHMKNAKKLNEKEYMPVKGDFFYDNIFELIGKDAPSNVKTLAEGEHDFSFKYQLPLDSPSSFMSKSGFVLHHCEATLIPKLFYGSKLTCSFNIDVISKVDLNLFDNLLTAPVKSEETKVEQSLFDKGENISTQLMLNRSGFVAGENIVITAEVINPTKCVVSETKVDLVQTVIYKGDFEPLTVHNIISSKNKTSLEATLLKWTEETLFVPDLPPTNLPVRNLIDIQYSVKFKVIPKSGSLDLEVVIPITIGSIPFDNQALLSGKKDPSNEKSALEFSSSQNKNTPTAPKDDHTFKPNDDIPEGAYAVQPLSNPSEPSVTQTTAGAQAYPNLSPPKYEDIFEAASDVNKGGNKKENK